MIFAKRLISCFALLCTLVVVAGCAAPKVLASPPDLRNILHAAEQRYQDGDLQAAAELYREAVAVEPQFTEGYLRLGVIAYRRGELKQAEQYFIKVLEREPNNQKALFDFSLLRIQQARELLDRYLTASTRQSPRRAEAQALEQQLHVIGNAD